MILKATLILLAGAGLSALARSAALRHLIWTLALAGTLLLPAMQWVVPGLEVGIWPDWSPPAPEAAPGPALSPAVIPAVEASGPAPDIVGPAVTVGAAGTPDGLSLERLLMGGWILGALLVATFVAAGHRSLAGLARRGAAVRDPYWQIALRDAADAAGTSTPVRLVETPRIGSPMVWGFRRPVVLLPPGTGSWPADRRRAVLEHELAHVARNDALPQLLAGAVCALYWFHPLAWLAAGRLRRESERACDDRVLAAGTPGAEYAGHLLEVARGSRRLRLAGLAAIGMARPSQLEGRLLAALDASRPRHSPTAGIRRSAWAALGVLVTPLAALRPVPPAERSPAADRQRPAVTTHRTANHEPAAQTPDSIVEHELEALAGEELILELESGGSVNLQGWDEPRVRVRARLAGLSWRDTRLTVERVDRGVRVQARQAGKRDFSSTNHHFEIRVPRRFDLRISSGGGGLTITEVDGTFRGHTGGGGFTIARAAGWADLSTGGGDIEVSDSDLRGSVSTGGGRVILSRVPRELRGSSGSGPVMYRDVGGDRTGQLTVAEGRATAVARAGGEGATVSAGSGRGGAVARAGQPGVLYLEQAGGDITLDQAEEGADVRTGGGRIRIGPAAGVVRAATGGGDIEIGPVAGSVVAGTGAGDVRVVIVPAQGMDQSVDVSAGVGAVVIELPPSFSGRFDLETAYTQNFEGRTRIESDWDLERDETSRWDDRQGTPRKYVRARGQVGSGGGLIRVRTVNGDITIHRGRDDRRGAR